MTSSNHSGHSARVKTELRVNGTSLRVAQMGPDFLVMDSPGEATLFLQVDESKREWKVRLPE